MSIQVLVTGATGYIATHIVQQLQHQGYKVRGTVRDKKNEQKVKPLYQLCPDAKFTLELVEADLNQSHGWLEAVQGCTFVIHVASPISDTEPVDEQDMIRPAVQGTQFILQACKDAKCVKRVVITSSDSAICADVGGEKGKIYTEEDWTDLSKCTMAYTKSKTLAERAAWDFISQLEKDEKFELVTINPTCVMGPMLTGAYSPSLEFVKRLMCNEMPLLPKMSMMVVDVRDVAAAHIAAMLHPEASGQRCIVTTKAPLWISDIAIILEKEFKDQGYKISTSNAPYPLMWLYGRIDKSVKMILPSLGKVTVFSSAKMKSILRMEPRPVEESIVDLAYSLIDNGIGHASRPNFHWDQSPESCVNVVSLISNFLCD